MKRLIKWALFCLGIFIVIAFIRGFSQPFKSNEELNTDKPIKEKVEKKKTVVNCDEPLFLDLLQEDIKENFENQFRIDNHFVTKDHPNYTIAGTAFNAYNKPFYFNYELKVDDSCKAIKFERTEFRRN